jgi:hypothetical protein
MTKFLNEHPDVLGVILTHFAAIGISFTDVEVGLKIISLMAAIGYTTWKWRSEWKKNNNG